MSSHQPYTYCITHKPSGKRYYGARFAKQCHPSDLFKSYFTSSKTVKKLIASDGIDAFSIEIRRIFSCGLKCLEWETKVLRRLKVSQNTKWLNLNENQIPTPSELSNTFRQLHGVSNPMQLQAVKDKSKKTMMLLYGVNHALQSPEIQANMASKNLEKFGVENVLSSPEIQARLRATNLERYGFENPMQSQQVKITLADSLMTKFGVDNYAKTDKFKQALVERHKRLNDVVCPSCGITTKSLGMKQWHFDNCTEKPILCVETNTIFRNARDAAKTVHMGTRNLANIITSIKSCCKGKPNFNSAYGFHWRYAD